MQAYSDPKRESNPYSLPDVEVFFMDMDDFLFAEPDTWMSEKMNDEEGIGTIMEHAKSLAGWYYWPCFPGCLPDGEAIGPFETEKEALEDAQEEE